MTSIALNNQGTDLASGVYAKLFTAEPKINITADQANWDDIPAGVSKESNTPYKFKIANDFTGDVSFNLEIHWTNPDGTLGTRTDPFTLNVENKKIAITNPPDGSTISGIQAIIATPLAGTVPSIVSFFYAPQGTNNWILIDEDESGVDGWKINWDTTRVNGVK